jgi:hypothetical protein
MAVFEIIDVQDTNSLDLNLFFPVGLPKGHDIIRAGITLEPKLLSITPNDGTPGGTWITVSVAGVGKLTTGLNIEIDTGESLCFDRKLIVEEYGKATCWSYLGNKFGDVATDMKLKFGDSLLDCSNADTTKCQYRQTGVDNDVWPIVNSLERTDNTLVMTGKNFYTVGYTATAFFKEIEATTVTIDSDTQATATFEGGLPITTEVDQSRERRANLIF